MLIATLAADHRATDGRRRAPDPGCARSSLGEVATLWTEAQLKATIFDVLEQIVPEADISTLGPDENMRETH